jgi:hypothetical protein
MARAGVAMIMVDPAGGVNLAERRIMMPLPAASSLRQRRSIEQIDKQAILFSQIGFKAGDGGHALLNGLWT